jgi:hypothetical protein
MPPPSNLSTLSNDVDSFNEVVRIATEEDCVESGGIGPVLLHPKERDQRHILQELNSYADDSTFLICLAGTFFSTIQDK